MCSAMFDHWREKKSRNKNERIRNKKRILELYKIFSVFMFSF